MKFRAGVTRMIADGVTKSFGQVVAIEDVGFKVEEHEFLAVLGPSGSGKTTLFRCLTGLLLPDRGTVRIDDHHVITLRGCSRRRIAVVFQQFNLVNRLTAFQNVLAGRLGHVPAWRGLTRRFNRTDKLLALDCLSRVGLLAQASQRANTLSGGQQQRVAIARALAQRPTLIVADEPIASLDPNSATGILDLLRSIARSEGVAVVCSLHQVQYARNYADRIVGLSRGRVKFDLSVAKFNQEAFDELYGPQATAFEIDGISAYGT